MATFAFILLAFLLMLGPVLLLRPSKVDAKLACMREAAMRQGIEVSLSSNACSGEKKSYAVYTVPWLKTPDDTFLAWLLFRQQYAHNIHFYGVWDWCKHDNTQHNQARDSASEKQWLRDLLDTVPENIRGVGVSRRGVHFYWHERLSGKNADESLAYVFKSLKHLSAIIREQYQDAFR